MMGFRSSPRGVRIPLLGEGQSHHSWRDATFHVKAGTRMTSLAVDVVRQGV